MRIMIEVSPGELLNKASILEIKSERISDADKLKHVRHELEILNQPRTNSITENEALWDIEDRIREREKASDFGDAFIEPARSVYTTNNRRASVKSAIDGLLNSDTGEVKSYAWALRLKLH